MSFFYISAAHKSSGKTTLTVGIAAALAEQGLKVQTFKKGPDYIDPLWLEKASGRSCYNLDFNTMNDEEIGQLFQRHSADAQVVLIEGNKGLYDGVDLEGRDSNAAMAKLLRAPVILVLDCAGITRGIAPLLQGYQNFDDDIEIAGVILNKVANARHGQKLKDIVKRFTAIPVMGCVFRDGSFLTKERHLGLIPPEETKNQSGQLGQLAKMVLNDVDLQALKALPSYQQCDVTRKPLDQKTIMPEKVKSGLQIGIIRDAAFGFYYADDLETFERFGADLIFINALQDQNLPKLDGLFIGGGFPETHLDQLEGNKSLRQQIVEAGLSGLPIYAECGGLMYLSRSITWQGQKADMVGLIEGDVVMHKKPQGRGLVYLEQTSKNLWRSLFDHDDKHAKAIFHGHEFHYASLENLPEQCHYALKVHRGFGITGQDDGIITHNVQANFSHLRHTKQKPWISEFLNFVAKVKAKEG